MRKRLFLLDGVLRWYDRWGAVEVRNLQKVMNLPEKVTGNPVLVREHPWEHVTAQLYGSVIYDDHDKLFKMWYLTIAEPGKGHRMLVNGRPHGLEALAYAVSADGIHWDKPELGLVEFDGSVRNNLLPLGSKDVEGVAVIKHDRDADPSRRYKALWYDHEAGRALKRPDGLVVGAGSEDGIFVACSPDGIHWTPEPTNPILPIYSDTGQQLVYDATVNRYVAFGRLGTGRRVVARSESEDFIHWSRPQLVFETDDVDPFMAQIYGMGTFLYEGFYIGLPWMFSQRTCDTRTQSNDDRIHVQMAASGDGSSWHRLGGRKPFLPNGPPEAWDGGIIYTATQPVFLQDRILIYYFGRQWPHMPGRDLSRPLGIGLATLRPDGFVSLDADAEGGDFITQETFDCRSLRRVCLNVEASRGEMSAVIVEENGYAPIGLGFSSRPIRGDHLRVPLIWDHNLKALPENLRFRLRIHLRQAKVFSYWVENENSTAEVAG